MRHERRVGVLGPAERTENRVGAARLAGPLGGSRRRRLYFPSARALTFLNVSVGRRWPGICPLLWLTL